MSKTLTRKGIALGTSVAFVAALLTGIAPANAATALTLVNNSGTGSSATTANAGRVNGNLPNSIRQSGVVLHIVPTGSWTNGAEDNPAPFDNGNTTISGCTGGVVPAGGFDTNQSSFVYLTITSTDGSDVRELSIPGWTRDGGASASSVTWRINTTSGTYAIGASTSDTATCNIATGETQIPVAISADDGLSNLSFSVAAGVDAPVNAQDVSLGTSKPVVLYSDNNVSGTISLAQPVLSSALTATMSFAPGLGINPYFVSAVGTGSAAQNASRVKALFKRDQADLSTAGAHGDFYVNASGLLEAVSNETAVLGNYTVVGFYQGVNNISGTSVFQRFITSETLASGIVGGISAAATGVSGTITNTTTNVRTASTGAYRVKAGVSAVEINVQAGSGTTNVALADSNLRFKAVMTAPAGTTASFTGGTSVTSAGSAIELFGRSDALGQSKIALNNPAAANGTSATVNLFVLNKAGAWVAINNTGTVNTSNNTQITIAWETAVLSDLSAPVRAASGNPAVFNFDVVDQFGGGINTFTDALPLSLTVVAVDGLGVQNSTRFLQTLAVPASGTVSFSIANYAPVGGSVQLLAQLHRTADTWTTAGALSSYNKSLRMYNNAPTEEITTVENAYAGEVTYVAFTTSIANGEAIATIRGTVETTTGVGAAAQAVTVSGTGLYFMFDPTDYAGLLDYDVAYASNSITVNTDINGQFAVRVFGHAVGNQTVSFTSGGKSTNVTLAVAHNSQLVASSANNVLTFSWPANYKPALGVSVVRAKFTDKWGNPVQGATVAFTSGATSADDFVFLDGVNAVSRTTDANGNTSLVRVRSFSTGRLQAPGMIDVDVTAITQRTANNTPSAVNSVDLFNVASVAANVTNRPWMGFFGTQATARAGAREGKVVVTVHNAVGRKIHVFAGAKLLRTVEATKRVHKFVATTKSGERNISVRVGKNVAKNTLLTKVVTVK